MADIEPVLDAVAGSIASAFKAIKEEKRSRDRNADEPRDWLNDDGCPICGDTSGVQHSHPIVIAPGYEREAVEAGLIAEEALGEEE